MDIKQLRTFVTLAKERNFTTTAQELHYAQSNVSNHIQRLEEELQVKLFNRIGHTITITDKGKELLPYATQILSLHKEALKKLSEQATNRIVIAASESICSYILPQKIQTYKKKYPNIEVVIIMLDTDDYLSLFEKGLVDMIFVLDQKVKNSYLNCIRITKEPMVLFSLPSHELAAKQQIQLEDFKNQNLVVTTKSCCYRKALESDFTNHGISFQPTLETSSIQIIKEFVLHDLGIGFLPEIALQHELSTKQLVALDYPTDYEIYSQLMIHKDQWISPELQAFVDLLLLN